MSSKRALRKEEERTWHRGGDCERANRKEEVSGGLGMTCCHHSGRRHSACDRAAAVAVAVGSCFDAEGYSFYYGFDTCPFLPHTNPSSRSAETNKTLTTKKRAISQNETKPNRKCLNKIKKI